MKVTSLVVLALCAGCAQSPVYSTPIVCNPGYHRELVGSVSQCVLNDVPANQHLRRDVPTTNDPHTQVNRDLDSIQDEVLRMKARVQEKEDQNQ